MLGASKEFVPSALESELPPRADSSWSKPVRQYIEMVFSELAHPFSKKVYTVTPRGFEQKSCGSCWPPPFSVCKGHLGLRSSVAKHPKVPRRSTDQTKVDLPDKMSAKSTTAPNNQPWHRQLPTCYQRRCALLSQS